MIKLIVILIIILANINSFGQDGVFSRVIAKDSIYVAGTWYSSFAGGGTVTNVGSGYGLSGGPITGIGTLLLDSATVFPQIRSTIFQRFGKSGEDNLMAASRTVNMNGNEFRWDDGGFSNYLIQAIESNGYLEYNIENLPASKAIFQSSSPGSWQVSASGQYGSQLFSAQASSSLIRSRIGNDWNQSGQWIDFLEESYNDGTNGGSYWYSHREKWTGSTPFTSSLMQMDSLGVSMRTKKTIGAGHTGYIGLLVDSNSNVRFENYPSSRQDGFTTKMLYIGNASGDVKYGYIDTFSIATRAALYKIVDSLPTGGSSTWNGITDPTGDQALTFDAGESSTWTDANTTEDLFTVNSSTGTTNSMFSLNRTGTALAAGNNIMELVSSGVNGANAITATGVRVSVTNTNGTSGTNIALSLTASGATTANQAINVTAGQTVLPAGTSTVPSITIGTAGLFDHPSNDIGIYANGFFRAAIGQSGLILGAAASVIDIGHSISLATNRIRISTPAEGTVRFSTSGATAAVIMQSYGGEGALASIALMADEGDDAADTWTVQSQVDNDFAVIGNVTEYLKITSAGVVTISNLAGTGSRAVLADDNGVLSAPVSDFSVKKNIQSLNYGLSTIMQLNPVSFEYKDGWKNYGKGTQIGFIAQDINKVLPNSTFITPSTGKMGYNSQDLVPILVKAMQEQQEEIDSLKKEVNKLKRKR